LGNWLSSLFFEKKFLFLKKKKSCFCCLFVFLFGRKRHKTSRHIAVWVEQDAIDAAIAAGRACEHSAHTKLLGLGLAAGTGTAAVTPSDPTATAGRGGFIGDVTGVAVDVIARGKDMGQKKWGASPFPLFFSFSLSLFCPTAARAPSCRFVGGKGYVSGALVDQGVDGFHAAEDDGGERLSAFSQGRCVDAVEVELCLQQHLIQPGQPPLLLRWRLSWRAILLHFILELSHLSLNRFESLFWCRRGSFWWLLLL
jgi:hypothetical protein